MTALTAGTGMSSFHKKSAKISVVICENRKNPFVAGDSGVVHIENHIAMKTFIKLE